MAQVNLMFQKTIHSRLKMIQACPVQINAPVTLTVLIVALNALIAVAAHMKQLQNPLLQLVILKVHFTALVMIPNKTTPILL